MARIAELANRVYAVAEDGLWTAGSTRTTPDEVVELTQAGQVAMASACRWHPTPVTHSSRELAQRP
jgi:hypothetical protein